ncbi:histidine phosphatase family protein [Rhizobium sp. P44RR-XXIV]|uniref:histidine phosphatase family protein n=1 Tax=Rhizobium sp. P44RR-XXIV TaxID=1921145 RepID=UPI000986586C|nr:histidine phosphatase family protein [Rhizobium sp. P44RR-XXIV]TIX87684.1 histidine phosphatase family protein [Rhizobium sp. P44RR-XXIV]
MAPVKIMIMRHAEKPDDPGDPNLSPAGDSRAKALVAWYPETFGAPDFIFAAAISKHSARPVETVQPLADALGLELHTPYADEDFTALAEDLLNKPKFEGKTILVCWHHGHIPGLMQALGAPVGSYPDPWVPTVFNLVLVAEFHHDTPTVSEVSEPF